MKSLTLPATFCSRPHLNGGRQRLMSPIAQYDHQLEEMIRELSVRIVVPRLSEFEDLWEITNKVCDRYGLGKAA